MELSDPSVTSRRVAPRCLGSRNWIRQARRRRDVDVHHSSDAMFIVPSFIVPGSFPQIARLLLTRQILAPLDDSYGFHMVFKFSQFHTR